MAPVQRFYVPTGGHKLIDIYRAMRDSFEQTIGNLDPSWYEESPEQMPDLYADQPELLKKADGRSRGASLRRQAPAAPVGPPVMKPREA